MSNKYDVVSDWLASLYGQGRVPTYEINERTLDLLYTLATENQVRDRQVDIMVDESDALREGYRSEAERLQKQLQAVSMCPEHLSQSGETSLETLTELAMALKLQDVSTSVYFAAISDLTSALSTLAEDKDRQKLVSDALLTETREIMARCSKLKAFVQQLTQRQDKMEELSKTKAQSIDYLESKSRQYRTTEANLKELLARSGVTPDMTHRALQQQHAKLQDLRSRIDPLLKQLDQFRDLPPDMALATLKIAEARKKLQQVEDSVVNNLGGRHPAEFITT